MGYNSNGLADAVISAIDQLVNTTDGPDLNFTIVLDEVVTFDLEAAQGTTTASITAAVDAAMCVHTLTCIVSTPSIAPGRRSRQLQSLGAGTGTSSVVQVNRTFWSDS